LLALVVVAAAGLFLLSCEDSNPIAQAGSTISLAANPEPINLLLGTTSTITARVYNANGVPAPDGTQVIFETNVGTMSVDETETQNGIATSVLTLSVAQSATVKAISGTVSATRTVTAVSGSVNTVTLTSPNPVIQLQCTDTVDLEGFVLDANGAGLPGQVPVISVVSSSPAGLRGNATVSTTDTNGHYTGTWLMVETDCTSNCVGANCTVTLKSTVLSKDSQQNLIVNETVP
jgi:hypothetical protein